MTDPSGPYRTASFTTLGHSFAFRVPDRALAAYLDRVLASLASPEPARRWWSVVERAAAGRPQRHRYLVRRGDADLFGCDRADDLAALLLWWVNRTACFETHHRLMVHAGVVAVDGRALLLPAGQDAGKTTLVTGLVQDGYQYLSDEAAALEPGTGAVDAYPKWLSLEPGSWPLFPGLRPRLPADQAGFAASQWHVSPDAVRAGSVAGRAEPAWVIVPRYRAGAATALEPIGRAEAVSVLASEAFNLRRLGTDGFHTLADVARRCRCWRLTTGALGDAVAAVRSVVA